MEYFTGYLVEKSLSVDNLFVFMLLLAAFAVPAVLAQRVLLYGITGALVLRAIFIALGAAALQTVDWAFLIFGGILIVTAVKIFKDAVTGHGAGGGRLLHAHDPAAAPVHAGHQRLPRLPPDRSQGGRRALTPLALVVVAVFATDIVFAVDSVPAVYGVTEDPFLVFATNAFALLGLRALYFVLGRAEKLRAPELRTRPSSWPSSGSSSSCTGRTASGRGAGDPHAGLAGGHRRGPGHRHGHKRVRQPPRR